VASEDLNCSLVFGPRQQDRPKNSKDVHRSTLSASTQHLAHSVHRSLELTGHTPPLSAPTSVIARRSPMLPLPMQFGCRELPLPLKHRSAVAGLLRYKQTILRSPSTT